MAPALIEAARGRFDRLIADRGYDGNAIRAAIHAQGAEVVIPTTRARKMPIPYDRDGYAPATSRTRTSTVGNTT